MRAALEKKPRETLSHNFGGMKTAENVSCPHCLTSRLVVRVNIAQNTVACWVDAHNTMDVSFSTDQSMNT